jgi:hypothetical protein
VNPDKLFDYLDGKLSATERAVLERQLVLDEQLQRELAVARRIHARTGGEPREVLLEAESDISERGRKLARRVGVAFIVLMAANVGVGLWFIARHESKNPNHALLEAQMRRQLAKSLERAAAAELSPAPLGVTDITVLAAPGKLDGIANEVVAIAQRLGGTGAKGIAEQHRVGLLVDLPSEREMEFRNKLAQISGVEPASPAPVEAGAAPGTKKSFAVEITESPLSKQ